MTIADIIQNSLFDDRHHEYLITPNGDYATEFRTYRLAHIISDNLVIASRFDGGFEDDEIEFDYDILMYLECETWNEIDNSSNGTTMISRLADGSAYDAIRYCVGGRTFANNVRDIVDASGILEVC